MLVSLRSIFHDRMLRSSGVKFRNAVKMDKISNTVPDGFTMQFPRQVPALPAVKDSPRLEAMVLLIIVPLIFSMTGALSPVMVTYMEGPILSCTM